MHTQKRLVMVGGPFSADTPEGCERNIVATEMLGIDVAAVGGAPIVPNSMGRSVMKSMTADYVGSPGYEVWIDITLSILNRSDAFIVTPTWAQSSGTRREVEAAFFFGVPVFYDVPSIKKWLAIPDHEVRVVSARDKYRLGLIRSAFLTPDLTALSDDLTTVQYALLAAQSLDDLSPALGPDANVKVVQYEHVLMARYDQLQKCLNDLLVED